MLEVLREFWNRNKRLNGNDEQEILQKKDLIYYWYKIEQVSLQILWK